MAVFAKTPVNPVPLTGVVMRSVTIGTGRILNINKQSRKGLKQDHETAMPISRLDILKIALMSSTAQRKCLDH